ncbi:MAG: pyridoxal-phosphate-dependent aminotransferase family protein [Culicoidibacterales bacterium]
MSKVTLFTPGPVQVNPKWMEAMAQPFFHHRGREFEQLMRQLQPKLQYTFQTQQPVMVMAGSGTLAMESAVRNLFAVGEHVLVVSIGYFGDVFAKIATLCGLQVTMLSFEKGTAAQAEDIAQAIAKDSTISGVLVTHHETATGVANDLKSIAEVVKETEALLVVDAISGLVIHELKMDEWEIDCVLTASQKSYFLPPGLAMCACSQKAWKKMHALPAKSYYQDWRLYEQMWRTKQQTPFTPPIPLLVGLNYACDAIIEEGLDNLQARHQAIRMFVQKQVIESGYELAPTDPHAQGNVLVAIRVDQGAKNITDYLESHGFMVAPGQGEEIETIFRIGCIGYLEKSDFENLFATLVAYKN